MYLSCLIILQIRESQTSLSLRQFECFHIDPCFFLFHTNLSQILSQHLHVVGLTHIGNALNKTKNRGSTVYSFELCQSFPVMTRGLSAIYKSCLILVCCWSYLYLFVFVFVYSISLENTSQYRSLRYSHFCFTSAVPCGFFSKSYLM